MIFFAKRSEVNKAHQELSKNTYGDYIAMEGMPHEEEKAPSPTSDAVNHPSHYSSGKIEVIEAIEDWKLGFNLGNAVKYVARAGKKDPAKTKEDLEKAIWYIRRQIELMKDAPRRPNDMDKDAFIKAMGGRPVAGRLE